MKGKKWFGFILILIMLSSAIVPSISSMQIKKNQPESRKNIDTLIEKDKYEKNKLAVSFDKLEYDRYEIINEQGYAVYNAKYTIKNIGDRFYFGWPVIMVKNTEDFWHLFDWWFEENRFIILRNRHRTYSHEIKIKTDDSSDILSERYFADRNVTLTVGNNGGFADDPDSNTRYVKYWNENEDYDPTLAHLLVSTPRKYETKSVEIGGEDFYYVKLIENAEIPNVIKNQRLGWVTELSTYITEIINDIEIILTECEEEFLIQILNDIRPIINWIIRVGNWFVELLHDICDTCEMYHLLNNFTEIKSNNIMPIGDISSSFYNEIIPEINKLIEDSDDYIAWFESRPWVQPVKISGIIENVKNNEIITIKCRNQEFLFKDEDDGINDSKINYEINVSSKPLPYENSYYQPHIYKLEINGSMHQNIIESTDLLSYCFSKGEIVKNFEKKDWAKIKTKDTEKTRLGNLPLISKIFDFLKKRPLLSLLNMKNMDYKPIQYKEYYPGAPTNDPTTCFYEAEEVIVGFKPWLFVGDLQDFLGFEIKEILPDINSALLDISDSTQNIWELILLLCDMLDVDYAQPNYWSTVTNDIESTGGGSEDWGFNAINMPGAWDVTKGDPSIEIAIVDSGINYHTDIKKPESERDFVRRDYRADDEVGHGTKVTGLIFSKWNSVGLNGVAVNCKYHSVKVLDPGDEGGETSIWRLARGILYAARPSGLFGLFGLNADVICLALTYNEGDAAEKRNPLRYACNMARNTYHSVLIAASHGTNYGTLIGYPAEYDTTICVGAVDENMNVKSPHGSAIDLVAPGVGIYTTEGNSGYEYYDGTSFATAFVAGIAALYFSHKGKHPLNPGKDVSNCENALKTGAQINDLGEKGKDDYYGHGLIDAYYATTGKNNLVVDFTWSPGIPKPGKLVRFQSTSYDPDGDIYNVAWDFTNDGKDDKWGEVVRISYPETGTFTVKMWVQSTDGQTKQTLKKISIKPRSKPLSI